MWIRKKVLKQGVNLTDVYNTIQAYMGGLFRQLLQRFRAHLAGICGSGSALSCTTNDLGQFYVRNGQGQPVPLTALAKFETRSGPRVHDAIQRVSVRADQC